MENIPPPLSLTLCGEGVLWVRREGVLEVRVGVHVLMSTGAWRCLDQGEHEVVHGTALVCISRRPSRFRARCAAKHSFSDSCTHRHRRALAKLWDLNENFGRQKKSKSPLLYGSVSTNTLIGFERTCTALHVFYFDFPRHATIPGHCRFCADCIKCVGVDGGPAPGARKRKPLIQ